MRINGLMSRFAVADFHAAVFPDARVERRVQSIIHFDISACNRVGSAVVLYSRGWLLGILVIWWSRRYQQAT